MCLEKVKANQSSYYNDFFLHFHGNIGVKYKMQNLNILSWESQCKWHRWVSGVIMFGELYRVDESLAEGYN